MISVTNVVKHNTRKKVAHDFNLMMTSHQVYPSWYEGNFESFENLLKLTVDRFYEKFPKFHKQQNCLNKTIGLIRKLQNLLPRTALITLYKDFVPVKNSLNKTSLSLAIQVLA